MFQKWKKLLSFCQLFFQFFLHLFPPLPSEKSSQIQVTIVNDIRKLTLSVRHSQKSPQPPFGKGGQGGILYLDSRVQMRIHQCQLI